MVATETGLVAPLPGGRALAEAKTLDEIKEIRDQAQREHIQRFLNGEWDAFYDVFRPFFPPVEE